MTDDKFVEIWRSVLSPMAGQLARRTRSSFQIEQETSLKLRYERYRNTAHEHFETEHAKICRSMGEKVNENTSDERIDRHKIAASMAIAICEVRPLRPFDSVTKIGYSFCANELLAIYVSTQIIRRYMSKTAKVGSDEELQTIAKRFPTYPLCSKSDYSRHLMVTMKNSSRGDNPSHDGYGRSVETILLYANIMFMLETHHLVRHGYSIKDYMDKFR